LEEANKITSEDLTGKLEEHIIAANENKVIQNDIEKMMRQQVENSE
jgi:hypothetical protein